MMERNKRLIGDQQQGSLGAGLGNDPTQIAPWQPGNPALDEAGGIC